MDVPGGSVIVPDCNDLSGEPSNPNIITFDALIQVYLFGYLKSKYIAAG